ncbi:PIN domain-containing protein [Cyclobacterium plantarum]|uniref:PIN domain-containing protein n=1 Tax=Cyclobacterium plantarum TaxID=2716263 RepID=A0ABX0H4C3_9BACT|nr:PIN domain-containing protein [Cyclobacterium plantarum]NHE56685.1 PIN domain-containing protein [Cyclobacterium plantarum]
MIYSSHFIAVLDACVLYPAPLRDLLLSFADCGQYKPKWSAEIQEEWSRNLLLNRPDLKKQQLQLTVESMNLAFPDSNVEKYGSFISGIILPDPDDRHVIAAAIGSKANVIVTFNLKDFPGSIEDEYGIEIQHPDDFLTNVYELHPVKAKEAFRKMVKRLKNPPKTYTEVLDTL